MQKNDLSPMLNIPGPSYVHPYEDVQDDDVCLELENIPAPIEQLVRRSTCVTRSPAWFIDYVMLNECQ
jgi:hypothetical protein